MRYKTQDPKYDIEVDSEGARLVNAATGKPIEADMPIFIFLAKDRKALPPLRNYMSDCVSNDHAAAVEKRIADFERFAAEHPEQMKEPDTVSSQ